MPDRGGARGPAVRKAPATASGAGSHFAQLDGQASRRAPAPGGRPARMPRRPAAPVGAPCPTARQLGLPRSCAGEPAPRHERGRSARATAPGRQPRVRARHCVRGAPGAPPARGPAAGAGSRAPRIRRRAGARHVPRPDGISWQRDNKERQVGSKYLMAGFGSSAGEFAGGGTE